MEEKLDKTAEIETRLKEIRISPDSTCLFYKSSAVAVGLTKRCIDCVYARFKKGDKLTNIGYCAFKSRTTRTVD